jgi:drug/metabolite transporter (DMT)-like permease
MVNFLLFLFLGSFWGGSYVAIKFAIAGCPSSLAAFLRLIVAVLFLTIVYLMLGKKFQVAPDRRIKVWISGLFAQGIPFALLFWGEKSVSAGLAGIINGTVPLWTFLLSLIYLKQLEQFSSRTVLGLILGFSGLILVYFPLIQIIHDPLHTLGVCAVTGMALAYSISIIMNRFIISGDKKVDLFAAVYQQHLASLVFLGAVTFLSMAISNDSFSLTQLSLETILSILYLGICSTGVAFLFWFRLIREWGAVRASSVTYLVPLVALVLDYIVLKTVHSTLEIVGTVIVLAGVFLLQKR